MEVKESEWVSKAIDNVDRYLNRGGDLKGDEAQILGGTDLLNTIGIAMGFNVRDPREWTDYELERALNNNLVYFDGDARKAIDVIANRIRKCCSGDDQNYVTVLPIELYFKGKLYELPLFRVHRYQTSKRYYVDNIGRSYDSVDDWFNNSKLPPCKMAYPYDLKLMLRPGYKYSRVLLHDTPSARVGTKIVKGVDIATSVIGIGSSLGLMFVTGGLAAPLVVTGAASAIYGTARTGHQLIDKATHGENINPFTNSESRMLWLGIAANVVSFGAMGASMRLTSLAARGRDISASLKLVVNVMNGTSLVVSSVAMIDTTIFLINHCDDLSAADVLLHVASVAFWTKGVFTYKNANALIKSAQDHTFMIISKELNPEDAANLSTVRSQFKNDAQLLKEFHRASEGNISIQKFSQIVIDASHQGQIQFDGAGNLVLPGGQKYSFGFLGELPQNVRRHYFDIITKLKPEQIELLESFRQKINNDMNLITGLDKVAVKYNLSAREATEQVLNFWSKYRQMNMPSGTDITIRDGSLVLGRAPPLQLTQLRALTSPMVHFLNEHLVRMDDSTSRQWATAMPVLLQLEGRGLLSKCSVTRIVASGRAVVLLNENLQVSIYRLKDIDKADCENIIKQIGALPPNASLADVPDATLQLVNRHRLRLECQRREMVRWMRTNANANASLLAIIDSNLLSFEQDRLFTFKGTVDAAKATPYMGKLMSFVSEMRPRNVSELVAYGEFAVSCVEEQKRALEGELRSGALRLPPNTKKAAFLRQKASEIVFRDTAPMRQKWERTLAVVRDNSMVCFAQLPAGLGDEALVAAVRGSRVGFASETSAAYHVLKHPTAPLGAYVERANRSVREAARWRSALTQDGDARLLQLEADSGAAILLERGGRVILATFSPHSS